MSNLCCWNCGSDVSDEPMPLSRQASCQKCGEFLHCCKLCTQFAPGRSGDCDNELADPPTDKTSANFCEYFIPNTHLKVSGSKPSDAEAKLAALFDDNEPGDGEPGDDEPDPLEPSTPEKKRNPLDDLFND
ncbi:MAG: hypothetical protein ACE37D_17370 [Pseudomonadales bacterium]